MDFTCIVLFLAIYHLKPQEWTSLFATIRFAQLTMFASVASLFFRGRSLKASDFFRTPHDWAMIVFFGWVVIASPGPFDTFKEFLNRLVFYVVIVQTLTSWDRIKRFLGWWTGMLVAVAALALMGEYFFDPLGSHSITHGIMKDRLILNLSMVNNPNALGHTVVPVIPMLYYFCIWKRPLFMKEVGLISFAIPLWCVYLTFSKGAYLAGAATLLATMMFGRPKAVQIALLAIALAGGITAVQTLPRMNELQKTKTDEAIQGRIRAFTYGRGYYDTLTRGVGQGKFIESLLRDHNYYKASHSTYVQTGAELGRTGLFLFMLIIWTSARTLLFARTQNAEQERVRRILFVLLLTYCVSGWMVDFAYRASFFMFVAAIGAFHRMLYLKAETSEETEQISQRPEFAWKPAAAEPALAPVPGVAIAGMPGAVVAMSSEEPAGRPMPWQRREEVEPQEDLEPPKPVWNRIGLADLVITAVLVYGTEQFWLYAIRTF
jgi:hypothetical protein